MSTLNDKEIRYAPGVDEDDKIVGKIWTRRQALAAGGLASLAGLFGCGGGGSKGDGGGTSGEASPSITTQPSNVTAVVGTSATFTVVATGDGLGYQWYSTAAGSTASTKIAGATGASYTVSSVTAAVSGTTYHVTVKNGKGTANSNNATLTVTTQAVAPSIATQPTSVSASVGSTAAFTVVAAGTNLSYQWYKGGTAISGATNATYAIANAALTDAGSYTVVVSNTAGTATSDAATLTVADAAPTITTQPASATVSAGGTATFTVVAGGSNLAYQWYRDGVAVSGATGATYTLASVATTDSGAGFYVVVTNSAGNVQSGTATLTVGTGISLVATPEAIEGPFWVDENLNRSDLVSPGASRSAVAGGYPLALTFTLYDYDSTTGTGTPLSGAHIDIWHADAHGVYSDESSGSIQSENTVGQTWLRGYQVTDASGKVTFATIHPGWYTGRTPHIHVRIRTYNASNNVTHNLTTQMFFSEAQNTTALSQSLYAHGTRTVYNSNDNVYTATAAGVQIGPHLLLDVDQTSSGETASFALAFKLS